MKRPTLPNAFQLSQERPSKVLCQRGSNAESLTERGGEDRLRQHLLSPFSSLSGRRDRTSFQRGRTRTPRNTTNSDERTNKINRWIDEIDNMSQPPSKRSRSISSDRDRPRSPSSDSERSSLQDSRSSAYKAVNYVTILETKGFFMHPSKDGPIPEDVQLCNRLLHQPIETPRGTMFEPEFIQNFRTALQNRSEARLLVDLHPLLFPSAENQYIQGKEWLKNVADGYNDSWLKTEPIYGPKPQPDHARGLKWSTFSETQRRKLGIRPDQKSLYITREDMYFPYLTAEVKCGNQALDIADRQNMHSMCIALRAVVTLAQAASSAETLHRRILGFSISHELQGLRIYGYYPEMDGEKVSFFRWPVANIGIWDNNNEWTCYRFVENIDREFLPIHTTRLMDFLDGMLDPGDITDNLQSPSVSSQEPASYRRTASSQGRGLQAELRSLIQTLQQQIEEQRLREDNLLAQLEGHRLREEALLAQLGELQSREAEQKEQFLAQLEQQRVREEEREANRNAREDKLLALLERK